VRICILHLLYRGAVKMATSQNDDTITVTKIARSKRRQSKTVTSQNGDRILTSWSEHLLDTQCFYLVIYLVGHSNHVDDHG